MSWTPRSHRRKSPPPDAPRPPAAAYYSLVDALEALENDPRHTDCRPVSRDTWQTYLDVRDYTTISVVTRYPICLAEEMQERTAVLTGAFIAGVNDQRFRHPCPGTVEEMGW